MRTPASTSWLDLGQTNRSPSYFEWLYSWPDAVDLQRDNPLSRHGVEHVDYRHAIQPRLNTWANRLDSEMVPLTRPKGGLRLRLVLEVNKPAATPFVVEPARPCPRRGVDFDLIPEDALVAFDLAPNLNAAIQLRIYQKLNRELEVAKRASEAQK